MAGHEQDRHLGREPGRRAGNVAAPGRGRRRSVAERQDCDCAGQHGRSRAVDRGAVTPRDGDDRRPVACGGRARDRHIAGDRDRGLDRRIAPRIRPPRDRAPERAAGNCRRPVARHAAERGRQNGLSGHRRRLRPISPRPLAGKGELGRDASHQGSRGGAGACPPVRSNPGTRPLWRAVFAPDLQGKRVFPHRAPGW